MIAIIFWQKSISQYRSDCDIIAIFIACDIYRNNPEVDDVSPNWEIPKKIANQSKAHKKEMLGFRYLKWNVYLYLLQFFFAPGFLTSRIIWGQIFHKLSRNEFAPFPSVFRARSIFLAIDRHRFLGELKLSNGMRY